MSLVIRALGLAARGLGVLVGVGLVAFGVSIALPPTDPDAIAGAVLWGVAGAALAIWAIEY